jgi:hypothetical protein
MIVKKLYRRTKHRWWDEERGVFQNTTVYEYLGWFLFGIIPIYLIELDKYEKVDFKDSGEGTLEYGIIKKYGYLMTGEKEK